MVGRRPQTASLPGCDEFPGGKCEPGESPRDSAVRECLEEAGLEVEPIELLLKRTFDYEHGNVELHFWLCEMRDEQGVDKVQGNWRWIPASELARLSFPEANATLVPILIARSISSGGNAQE